MINEKTFNSNGPYWHVCTDGTKSPIYLETEDDFRFAMNAVPTAFFKCKRMLQDEGEIESKDYNAPTDNDFLGNNDPTMLTFSVMGSHLHSILRCSKKFALNFELIYLAKISRYLAQKGVNFDPRKSANEPIEIANISMMRTEIVYVNRNGYVANEDTMPYTYKWSSAPWFFNPMMSLIPTKPYNSLSIKAKREIEHTRIPEITEPVSIIGTIINPVSYCDLAHAEAFFSNAHDYFNKLGRDVESYAAVSQKLGEAKCMTYPELKTAVYSFCRKELNCSDPTFLSTDQRLVVARKMHFDFHASNSLISKMLGLATTAVNELFPTIGNNKR